MDLRRSPPRDSGRAKQPGGDSQDARALAVVVLPEIGGNGAAGPTMPPHALAVSRFVISESRYRVSCSLTR
jgi:hypothetical protein